MRGTVQSSPDDIDITQLGSALARNAKALLFGVLATGVATYGVLCMVTPRYVADARINIKDDESPITRPKSDRIDSSSGRLDPQAVVSQVQVMQSRNLATKVIGALQLEKQAEFNPNLKSRGIADGLLQLVGLGAQRTQGGDDDGVMETFKKGLQVYQVRDSRTIVIEFSASDPQLTAKVANSLAETYLEWQRSETVKQNTDASKWLGDEIKKLKEDVAKAEAAVEKYRAEFGLFASATKDVTLNTQQLTDLNTQLSKTKAERSEAETRARLIRDMMGRPGGVEAAPDVVKSPMVQGLIQQRIRLERDISQLSATLLPAHPRMRQLQAELGGLNQQMKGEVRKVVDSLENEAKIAGAREASLKQSLDEMSGKAARSSGDEVKLKALERDAKSKRELLETRQAALGEANSRRSPTAIPAFAEIIQTAQVPSIPVFPKKLPLTLLAMATSFALGLFGVLTREAMRSARRSVQPAYNPGPAYDQGVEPQFHQAARLAPEAEPKRAETAPAALKSMPARQPVPAEVRGAEAEDASLDGIAKRLIKRAQSEPGYRTILTGDAAALEVVGEAIELARGLSAAGRQVVLIEWSETGEPVSRLLGLKPAPGMQDLLAGTVDFESVVQRMPDAGVHVMTSGSAPQSTAADADRLNLVFDALDETYDHIVVFAARGAAEALFSTMQGRFDTGLLVGEDGARNAEDGEGVFLGYQVPELDVIGYQRPAFGRRRSPRATGEAVAAAF